MKISVFFNFSINTVLAIICLFALILYFKNLCHASVCFLAFAVNSAMCISIFKLFVLGLQDNIFIYRLLGLDLVVRDDEGNVLNPETASVIKIYREVGCQITVFWGKNG